MRSFLLGLWLVCLPALAAPVVVDFTNVREGSSYYDSKVNNRKISALLKSIDRLELLDSYDDVIQNSDASQLCAYNFNTELISTIQRSHTRFNKLDALIYFLRSENKIDDSVAKILLDAHKTTQTEVYLPGRSAHLPLPDKNVIRKVLPLIGSFTTMFLPRSCLDEAFRNLYSEIQKMDKKLDRKNVEALFVLAFRERVIDLETYELLEKARVNEVELSGLTLKAYHQKVSSLRNQYPLRDPREKSHFVTEKVDKMRLSRRQRLLETYTDLQIIMMGNVIQKLRTRLEATKVEILIYDRSQGVETITLEPMERFRLAIKLLRKEMAYLSLNTYFAGRTPDYFDLMTAAYETGIIPASELNELAGLQDIWNPKKTFWEKSRVWVQTLGSVATIVIPPPYGFIPALALVVIEATVGQKSNANTEDPTGLF